MLAIWLDAFRASYLSQDSTPYLFQLSRQGVNAEYRPPLAFTGIGASIVTGVSPLKHGVWVEFNFDPEHSIYRWLERSWVSEKLATLAGREPRTKFDLGHLALNELVYRLSNMKTGRRYKPIAHRIPTSLLPFFNPALEDDIFWHTFSVPSLISILDSNDVKYRILSDSVYRDKAIVERALRVERGVQFKFIQLASLDSVGHRFGPDSTIMSQTLKQVDENLRQIVEKQKLYCQTDVLIFADHGMDKVSSSVDILHSLSRLGLVHGRDYLVFVDSTIARVWPLREQVREIIETSLQGIENGRLLADEDFAKYKIPRGSRYGDSIWLADPGTVIIPNYYQGHTLARGMHGYAPDSEGQQSAIIANGENLSAGTTKWVASPMDIFATMLDFLDVRIPGYAEGKSIL